MEPIKRRGKLRDRIVPLTVKVDALVEISRTAVDEARVKIVEITRQTNQILDVAKATNGDRGRGLAGRVLANPQAIGARRNRGRRRP